MDKDFIIINKQQIMYSNLALAEFLTYNKVKYGFSNVLNAQINQ